jgi:hypothetical protein
MMASLFTDVSVSKKSMPGRETESDSILSTGIFGQASETSISHFTAQENGIEPRDATSSTSSDCGISQQAFPFIVKDSLSYSKGGS